MIGSIWGMKIPVIILAEAQREAAISRRDLEAQKNVIAQMRERGIDTAKSDGALYALEPLQKLRASEVERARQDVDEKLKRQKRRRSSFSMIDPKADEPSCTRNSPFAAKARTPTLRWASHFRRRRAFTAIIAAFRSQS
jgi:hypothetical protein